MRETLTAEEADDQWLRLAKLEVELDALCALEQRQVEGRSASAASASVLKILGSELKQKACALALDVGLDFADSARALLLRQQYFGSRAASIYSGANEIQRNIVARAILG